MLLAALGCALAAACSGPGAVLSGAGVDPDRFAAHVAWLAHDDRGGRQTGSPELDEAAAYVAAQLAAAGLLPLGDDGDWYDGFTAIGRRELRSGNELVVRGGDGERAWTLGSDWALGDDWIPLRTALRAHREGPVVFAGYGLVDAESGWDDYAALAAGGVDVRGAIVVVLRGSPRAGADVGPAAASAPGDGSAAAAGAAPFDAPRWRDTRSFARKIENAFGRGAAGLIVVNDPLRHPPGSALDIVQPYGPIGASGWAASLPAVQLTAAAGAELLAAAGYELRALQEHIDASARPHGAALDGVRAELAVRSRRPRVSAANVVGLLPGTDPALRDEPILVGAHLDHLGLGRRAGTRGGPDAVGQVHNGADDNASGVAGLIEIARVLSAQRDRLPRGVVFAAFSAEEWGLQGSTHLAGRDLADGSRPVAVLNMDMIGRSRDGYVLVEGVGSGEGLEALVVEAHRALGAPLDLHVAATTEGASDHGPFLRRGVPALNVFTGRHEQYHTPDDDAELIEAQSGADVAMLVAEVAARLSRLPAPPRFVPLELPAEDVVAGEGIGWDREAHRRPGRAPR